MATFNGDENNNTLTGNANEDDTFFGGAGNDTINALSGNDRYFDEAGDDLFFGGDGVDTIDFTSLGAAVTVGFAHSTTFFAASNGQNEALTFGVESFVGTAFNDTFDMSPYLGATTLQGEDGADTLIGNGSNTTASYDISFAAVTINLATGATSGGHAEGDSLTHITHLIGSGQGDALTGNGGDNSIAGGNGNDTIIGGAGADTLAGGDGVDTLTYASSGAGVNVNLSNATGHTGGDAAGDSLSGFENLIGSDHHDELTGDANANVLVGGAGSDNLNGGEGNDTIVGAQGDDVIVGGNGVDVLDLSGVQGAVEFDQDFIGAIRGTGFFAILDGIERLVLTTQNDVIIFNAGVRDLFGGAGNDTLWGGDDFDDTIEGGVGADNLNGFDGTDTLVYATSSAGVTVNIGANTASGGDAAGDTIQNFEHLVGSAHADQLTGTSSANNIQGGDGNDTINGGAGGDTLVGGSGTNTVSYAGSAQGVTLNMHTNTYSGGDAAGDSLSGFAVIIGSDGNDNISGSTTIETMEGGAGADTLDAGPGIGFDAVSYASSNAGVTVRMDGTTSAGGHAEGDVVTNFRILIGSQHGDSLIGSNASETLIGGAGADAIDGGGSFDYVEYRTSTAGVTINLLNGAGSGGDAAGDSFTNVEGAIGSRLNDAITGGAGVNFLDGDVGNDTIEGGQGADILMGGEGNDTVSYASSSAGVNVSIEFASAAGVGGDAEGDDLNGFEAVIGSAHNDTLTGSGTHDTIEGGAGADVINGANGQDMLSYNSSLVAVSVNLTTGAASGGHAQGDTFQNMEGVTGSSHGDTLVGGASEETINGGGGDDLIVGTNGWDTLDGGDQIDTLSYANSAAGILIEIANGTGSGFGSDSFGDRFSNFERYVGSAFADTITGGDFSETIEGGEGGDSIDAGAAADSIDGGAGNDTINGGQGDDAIAGGEGDDVFAVSFGADTINGGAGFDTLDWSALGAGIYLGDVGGTQRASVALVLSADLVSVERIIATNLDDTLIGSSGDDTFRGRGGADQLTGGAGSDTLSYEGSAAGVTINLANNTAAGGDAEGDVYTGFENVIGTANSDHLTGDNAANVFTGGDGSDTISAGLGDDRVIAAMSDGDDRLLGDTGFDVLDYSGVGGVVQVNQLAGTSTGSAGNDTLVDVFEQVIGTAFDDVLSGGHGINILDGMGGNDQLYGNNDNDLVRGGAGNDQFFSSAGDGNDRYFGGADDDTIYAALLDGDDTLRGDGGFDVLDYSNVGGVVQVNQLAGTTTGSAGNDTLVDAFEQVIGTNFGDVLSGGHGINALIGGGGNDTIFANNGDDYVNGGTGSDTIYLGVGNDVFDFRNGEGVDTLKDFTAGGTEDRVGLNNYTGLGFNDFAGLAASGRLSTVNGAAELLLNNGDKIIFESVANHALLTAADFQF
jgi:Ca2+-binding RTX toxin-like protein